MPGIDFKKQLVVISGYTIIALITTYPLIFNMSLLLGPAEDNQMFVWNMWWFKYSIFELGVSPFYTNYLFLPEGASLIFHTYSPLNNIFALVLTLFSGYIASYNILILLTFIIGAYGCFKLARELGLSYEASFIAGIIYSFNPFHLAHAGHHLNISSIQLIPFLLLFAIKAGRTSKPRYIIIASLLLAANFYLDYYIFLFSIFLLIPLLFFRLSSKSEKSRIQQMMPVLLILIIGGFSTLPLSIPMITQSLTTEFEPMARQDIFAADLAGFVFPHKLHWTKFMELNNKINSLYKGNYWESASFLGYVVLAMAIWAILKIKLKFKKYFLVIGLLGIVLALGSYPHFLGKSITFLKLPYYIIQYIPGLNAARSPGRFIILTYLALAIFASIAINSWVKTISDKGGKIKAKIAFIAIIAIIICEYWSAPFQLTKIKTANFYQTIRSEADDFAILNLPPGSRNVNLRYMFYQINHQKPIDGGQLARSRKSIENYYQRWRGVEMTAEVLKERRVKYIILHGEFLLPATYLDYFNRLNNIFVFVTEENKTALFQVY